MASALLTVESRNAAHMGRVEFGETHVDAVLRLFLEHHRTDGREALVEAVRLAVCESVGTYEKGKCAAEKIVEALVGSGTGNSHVR